MSTTSLTADSAPIILIPPTHEQSIYTFHVEEPLLTRFMEFLEQKGLTPWRTPFALDKEDKDGVPLIQVEIDTTSTPAMMENLVEEFQEGE